MSASVKRVRAIALLSVLELYRRKDLYVAVILGVVILLPLASVSLFGVKGIVRYLREVSLLLIWIFSIAIGVTTAARQIPAEIEKRTIYPLLARPLPMRDFVAGKFFGAWFATGSSILLFYTMFALLSGLKEGSWFPPVFWQALLLHLCFAALLSAMTVCGSTILSAAGNVTICTLIAAAMLLFGDRLLALAHGAAAPAGLVLRFLHFGAPHYEFFDLRLRLIHNWEALPPSTLLCLLAYGALYCLVFLTAATAAMRRKAL